MKGFHPYVKILPTVRAYVARPLRWGVTGAPYGCRDTALLVVGLLLLLAGVLTAQVNAAVQMHGRDAEVAVTNPTAKPLRVTMALYQDVTPAGGPLTLGDSVPARISPASFTLQPGATQTVRVRLRTPLQPGEVLRLATTFAPGAEEPAPTTPAVVMRFVAVIRVLTKVEGAGP